MRRLCGIPFQRVETSQRCAESEAKISDKSLRMTSAGDESGRAAVGAVYESETGGSGHEPD